MDEIWCVDFRSLKLSVTFHVPRWLKETMGSENKNHSVTVFWVSKLCQIKKLLKDMQKGDNAAVPNVYFPFFLKERCIFSPRNESEEKKTSND